LFRSFLWYGGEIVAQYIMIKKIKYVIAIFFIVIISPLITKITGDFCYKNAMNKYEKEYDKYRILEMNSYTKKTKEPAEPKRKDFISGYSWGEGLFGVLILSLYAICLTIPTWVALKFRRNILQFFSKESPYKFSLIQRILFILLVILSAYIAIDFWEDEGRLGFLVSATIGTGALILALTKK